MNQNSQNGGGRPRPPDPSAGPPILVVPYMWIGDFVRCHSVVRVLRERFPGRAVDLLATTLCAPLVDYMPGVRRALVVDVPRKRLALAVHYRLAQRLKREGYAAALIMPKTWKSALAPFLAGIPQRTGLVGECRFILLNDLRFGRHKWPRMVDECAVLALPAGAPLPAAWPAPQLIVPAAEVAAWRSRIGLTGPA
ncbi:MAG: lipopolysaccharide heptosyltransferase II, partial [Xanthobacteraceae bacterium]